MAASHVRQAGIYLSLQGQARRINKPGATIGVGDVVTFGMAGHILTIEVLDLGLRRGPAPEARRLYRQLETDA
jgi:ribosome-associated heat shock protein Hsp15